ncbi:hypothetical protein [Rhodococcus sp. ACS1]|uniref:hypothetical protein n=1 Tax=Rhodococcus sp. ACS1 TaxID=2028570 RepID=UPI00359C54AA
MDAVILGNVVQAGVGPNPNTVQLVNKDGAFRRLGGLWMVLMVCAFGCPLEDFAFDDPGVGAVAACGVDSAQ